MNFLTWGLTIGIPALVLLIVVIFLVGYTKATPDEAKVISGLRKNPRTIIGKAGFRWPLLERVDTLKLQLISVDVQTSSAVPTADYINVNVDCIVNVQVSKDPNRILLAERNFLNKPITNICETAKQVLEGNIREIVGKMTLPDMVSDRKKFNDLVMESAGPDLAAMGLDIISFNVQNFIDDNHVIENLGVDNIVKIQKQAAISRAESEKEIAQAQALSRTEIAKAEANRDLEIAKAKADTDMKAKQKEAESQLAIQKAQIERDREAKQAQVEADQLIVEKENEKNIKQAELEAKTNAERAKADAAYEIESQTQRKEVEAATAEANLTKQEKEVEIRKKNAEIQQAELDAQIKKRADAEKYAAQAKADADAYQKIKDAEARKAEVEAKAAAELVQQQKAAEAEKYRQEKEAEAKIAQAEAEKQKLINEAEGQKALAEAIQAKGEADAAAIKAKLEAEAEGIKQKLLAEAEGIDKKAEAQKKMGEASITEMQLEALKVYFQQLPAIAANMAKPLENIDSITMYGEGDVSKFMNGLTSTFKQITDGMGATGGINLQSLVASFLGNKIAGANNSNAATATALTEVGKKLLNNTDTSVNKNNSVKEQV